MAIEGASGAGGVVHRVEVRVRYAETDQMGVVYHANYLVFCEIGRTDFIRQFGRSYADLEGEGVRLAVADLSARYLAPARYDDRLEIATAVAEVRSRAVTFEYVITNADTGQRLVSARTTLVSLDAENRLVALPSDLRDALQGAAAR